MYKCDKTEILSLSLASMGMKQSKQWGSTTISNLRSHVLISTCHSVSDMSITIVLNFFYIYLYILCTKSVFLRWIKRVFEDVSLSTNPILAVCLRVQQKSVWCWYSSCFYWFHSVSILRSQVSNTSWFLSTSLREGWRRTSHQQCLQCGLSEASKLPWPALALPPHTWGVSSRVTESRSGGEVLCGSRGGGWPGLPCSGSSPSSFAPPRQAADRGEGEHHENLKRWTVATVIVWVDCFGQSSGTDWGCSCRGVHHWAGCPRFHFPDLLSSPASPGWEEAWSLGSPSSEWWLARLLQENTK